MIDSETNLLQKHKLFHKYKRGAFYEQNVNEMLANIKAPLHYIQDGKNMLNFPTLLRLRKKKKKNSKFFLTFLKLFNIRDLDDELLLNEEDYYHFIRTKFIIKHPRENRRLVIIGKIFKLSKIFLFCLLYVSYNN